MRLPLFPLDVVLFPGALLPLHIFEPRYRTMLADCLGSDQRFGILPPGEDGTPPPTGVIGAVAVIRATQPLPDGRINIVVEGAGRFMLRRYVEADSSYLVGLAEPFDDDPEDEEDATRYVPELRGLADRCANALRSLIDAPPPPTWAADAGMLSFQVASQLDLDGTFKRRFLGIRSASERAVLLVQLLPGIVTDLEARAAVRRRASSNGKGGTHPDIVMPS
jgi:Lon protease-like protein